MVCIFLRRILQDLAFYSTLVSFLFKEQNPDNLPVLYNGLATPVNMVSSYCISLANLVIPFMTYFMLSSSLSSLSSCSLFSTSPIILPQNPLQFFFCASLDFSSSITNFTSLSSFFFHIIHAPRIHPATSPSSLLSISNY